MIKFVIIFLTTPLYNITWPCFSVCQARFKNKCKTFMAFAIVCTVIAAFISLFFHEQGKSVLLNSEWDIIFQIFPEVFSDVLMYLGYTFEHWNYIYWLKPFIFLSKFISSSWRIVELSCAVTKRSIFLFFEMNHEHLLAKSPWWKELHRLKKRGMFAHVW